MRVIEKVKVGKRGDDTLIRVEGQANCYSVICVRDLHGDRGPEALQEGR
jgi:hypothetical protein